MHSKIEENSQSNKIYYWNGILDPNDLSTLYSDTIEKLVEGNYAGLDLEKLAGHNVYSVRINKSDRLLFTTIMVKNQPYLMLLDVVLNHDYAKSRFLKPAVLKHYMEVHGKQISEEIIQKHFHKQDESVCFLPKKDTKPSIDYSRIDFYNQKFIELDETQLLVANKVSLPLIISGAPGSGKSCIALLILAQYIEADTENEYPILYVTESDNLAASMQRAWQSLPIAQNRHANDVQFKSYQQLIRDLQGNGLDFVDKNHCMNWLTNHIKQSKKVCMTTKKTDVEDSLFDNLDAIYQEFRIISGCRDIKAYVALGQKQSLFLGEKEQEWLFKAFLSYQDHLEDVQCIHAPFCILDAKDKYKRIVVDEAQDFSHRQLLTLFHLAEKSQICYCEDNRQSLSDTKSKIPFLKSIMYSSGARENHITLPASYRCPKEVITIANAVSALKSIVTGQGQPDILVPGEQTEIGRVTWYSSLSESELAWLQNAASSPDFAIITAPDYKNEAKKRFRTPLVFSPDEIKGLEYKHIMAYRLFDAPAFKDADKLVGKTSPGFSKKTGNRAKKDQGNEEFGPLFSGIYTAFTRATDTLYIFQENDHGLSNIVTRLADSISKHQETPIINNTVPVENNTTEWFNQVKLQLALGNEEVARTIYLEKLNKTDNEFNEIKKLYSDSGQPAKPVEIKNNIPSETAITIKQTKKQPVVPDNRISSNPVSKIVTNEIPLKVPDAITKLLKNVNETTLFQFLKHKKAKEYLFHTPLPKGVCLFSSFFFTTNSFTALYYCIPKYLKLFSLNMTEEALCQSRAQVRVNNGEKYAGYNNTSAFYWFMASVEGIKIFSLMLATNPDIAKLITSEALCTPLSADAKGSANASALYLLSSTSLGRALFSALIELNPDFCKLISIEALCLPLTSLAGDSANVSPLYCLTETMDGLSILIKLCKENQKLAISLPGDALCRSLPKTAGRFACISPIYYLSSCILGIEILNGFLSSNPQLVKEISADALCLPLPIQAGPSANGSPLYWLSVRDSGRKLLLNMFENNEALAKSIKGEILKLKCINASDEFANISALQGLLLDETGHQILYLLLRKNTVLVKMLACYILDSNSDQEVETLSLVLTNAGQKIIEMLANLEPTSVNSQVSRPSQAGMFSTTSTIGDAVNEEKVEDNSFELSRQ